ncbi:hypothetical protein SOVF_106480 [Spinacia oleracea]|nr:hypothetical protein SOVF_106480 [Spinacia oleracea]
MTFIVLNFLFVLLSSASACDRCLHQSKATYTSKISSGACGYESLAMGFNGGMLAGGLPSLFKQGAGCGACFKVRCKNAGLCRSEGTRVMLTELQGDNRADFVLNRNAYVAMAHKGMSQSLVNLGIVDIEYKRVPCDNKSKNLAIRVENYSSKPYYLAFTVLHQGGQTEIMGIDLAQVGSNNWASMKRNYGAVWDTNKVPSGPLKLRFLVKSGYSTKSILTQKVFPADWKSGVVYDAGIQIVDIAQEECSVCHKSNW